MSKADGWWYKFALALILSKLSTSNTAAFAMWLFAGVCLVMWLIETFRELRDR